MLVPVTFLIYVMTSTPSFVPLTVSITELFTVNKKQWTREGQRRLRFPYGFYTKVNPPSFQSLRVTSLSNLIFYYRFPRHRSVTVLSLCLPKVKLRPVFQSSHCLLFQSKSFYVSGPLKFSLVTVKKTVTYL